MEDRQRVAFMAVDRMIKQLPRDVQEFAGRVTWNVCTWLSVRETADGRQMIGVDVADPPADGRRVNGVADLGAMVIWLTWPVVLLPDVGVMAHELAHLWLHSNGQPNTEGAADNLARVWGFARTGRPHPNSAELFDVIETTAQHPRHFSPT